MKGKCHMYGKKKPAKKKVMKKKPALKVSKKKKKSYDPRRA